MPSSLHKITFIFILTTLLLVGFIPDSFSASPTEQTIFKGLYPVPFISTDKIILKPRAESSMAICENGTLYVDNSTGSLVVCGLNNSKSKNIWTQGGNFVYPTNLAPDLEVSVGDKNNSAPFNIFGPKTSTQNLITLDPTGGMNSAGITLKMDGTYTGPPSQNYSDYIDFHAGNQGQDFDGRILYSNDLSGLQGFGLLGAYNMMNIWIDRAKHYVGIGTTNPSQRLDIIGDIETNNIALDADGVLGPDPAGDLKVTYVDLGAGSGGYYAVYAP